MSLLWASVLFVQIREHRGCIEEERIGLLELKAFMKSNSNDVDHLLPSWVNGTKSECCDWEGVKCSKTTDHLIELSLHSNFSEDNYNYGNQKAWFLNVSLLHPFKELRSLDFSFNAIGGWLGNEESNCLSKLTKLTHLNLSRTHFDKENFRFLGALPVLKSLDLSYTHMKGPLSGKELVNLSNLEVLILQLSQLNGSLPFKDMVNFSNLEILDLSYNDFTGSISPYIGALSSLKAISLSYNHLNGTLPTQDLCGLKKLEELDFAANEFEGSLPLCLNNLTSLKLFDISRNLFSGIVPSSSISSMTSLEYIDLSKNSFEGLFSFSLFANHSKLKVIQFLSNNNKLEIETDNPSWHPLFQLKVLVLSNCNLNKLTRNIPKFLFDQHELEEVDISHSMLKGSFPTWLLENNTELQVLSLQGNSFTGQLHLPPYLNYLYWLDVSENYLDGELPENIGMMIPNLECLNVSRNKIKGNLPSSIGDMSNLKRLDLSFNNFSGEVTTKSFANQTALEILSLSNNNFHGDFFSKLANLSGLLYLGLNNNHFSGTLPLITSLLVDISNNSMSGMIPEWIGNSTLKTGPYFLFMSDNFFEGRVPCELGHYNIIDLSHNLLSGSFPSCFNVQDVRHILLRGNRLTGTLPKAVFNSSSLLTLDIKDNRFFGSIPDEIDGPSGLSLLLLSGNYFSGIIPRQLCRLKNISIMDLSKNFFSGTIPYCFYNITFGKLGAINFDYSPRLYHGPINYNYDVSPTHKRLLNWEVLIQRTFPGIGAEVEINFVTKYRSNSYKGSILKFMSGLDLSFNKLTGKLPDMKAQFATFNESSYEGNPFLCGPPLKKSCSVVKGSPPSPQNSSKASDRKWYEVDLPVFSTSFLVSFTVFFLGVVSILYINPHWRQQCFNLVEDRMFWCYYFASKTLKRLSNRMFH
ncbi:hypothetical protein CMV_022474 [Castanea mollissima]|uniref:Leucine-rich repeat-containing N-terminal plant-type domain-containing protein n=1 Tax=Castanea mollissima TaxID=60419 RepID=A0A8J4VK86_9ROSI|nr:hypothetical protein CMV_022474 [Castanea mollissima]